MAGGKETPRQKMIGMMYLVLTALLALQVSSEIINKFDLINKSLESSANEASVSNQKLIEGIQKSVAEGGTAKNQQYLQVAQNVKAETQKIMTYLDELKKQMVTKSGGIKEDGAYQNPSAETEMEELMVGATKNGKGYEVKQKLNDYINFLNQTTGKIGASNMRFDMLGLDAKEVKALQNDPAQKNKDFAELNFAQTPMVAGLAVISQKQNEIARHEAAVLNRIAEEVGAVIIKVDKFVAMVRPEARVVAAGTKYKAQMFLAASSSSIKPSMALNGSAINVDAAGMGKIEFTAQGGAYDKDGNLKKTWKGTVTIPKRGGGDTTFVVNEEYIVAKPVIQVQSASVQALYVNCGNELKIQVPALGADYSPSFSASGAQIIQGAQKGDVTVVPTSVTPVSINVSSGGNAIGTEKFNVRPVPKPEVKAFANGREMDVKRGIDAPYPGTIEMRAMADEGFRNFLPKDARFQVSTFEVFLVRGRKPVGSVRGDNGRASIGGLASQARPGDRILIEIKGVKRMNFKGQVLESGWTGGTNISVALN